MKRKLNYKALAIILTAVAGVVVLFVLLTTNFAFVGRKSIHSDAKKYKTSHCMVFYPNGNKGKEVAKQICKNVNDDSIFDYSLIPYGDYYLVNYGSGYEYFADKNYNAFTIDSIDEGAKGILSDYLRYTVKKNDPDRYFNNRFIKDSSKEKLKTEGMTFELIREDVKVHYPDFDLDILIPTRFLQPYLGMNLGYSDTVYTKPVYIDPDRPIVALTFDDGPNFWSKEPTSSQRIVDTLYENDAVGTFFVVGYCLDENNVQEMEFLRKSIMQGNEYGSKTQSHDYLLNITSKTELQTKIGGPADFFNKHFDYQMKLYRIPDGDINDFVAENDQFTAVFWNEDPEDWYYRDKDDLYEKLVNQGEFMYRIIVLHDIFDETADALTSAIPTMVNNGVQFVTVSDLMNYLGVSSKADIFPEW